MSLSVKICGITTLEDARYAAAGGADMLGFIQYPPSPRYVEADHARALLKWIHGPQSVGVFVNESLATVNAMAEVAGFDLVQLHGNESPGYCRQVVRPVIKAFNVRPDSTPAALRAHMASYLGCVRYFLMDTYHPVLRGGTGETFSWTVAAALATDFPMLLAGGIGPRNVLDAVREVRPFGVDCSSRLESAPGQKDFDLMAEFFDALRHLRS